MEKLEGKIQGILFNNKVNGFSVLKIRVGEDINRVCGAFPGIVLSVGLKVRFTGSREVHQTYGPQFTASTCEVIPESGRNGIISFITNNINSIGIVTASKLYDFYGDELVNVLDYEPEKLKDSGILTDKQYEVILQDWQSVNESKNSSIYLSNLGLTGNQIKGVLTLFGGDSRRMISENPYLLCKCSGIGFSAADQAARIVGIGVDDSRRVKSMILYIVEDLCNSDGHMYVTSGEILKYGSGRFFRRHSLEPFSHGDKITDSQYYGALNSLLESGELVSINDKIYTKCNWEYEHSIAKYLSSALLSDPYEFKNLDVFLKEFQKRNKIKLSEDQISAFKLLGKSRIVSISGYPGTGKTTLISSFVELFSNYNLDFSLLSPTGIAAKRLSKVTGKMASTIHRALGYKKDGTWEFNHTNKFITDAIIVDEMSMVDSASFYHLLDALNPSTILILVGDSAQLPSVGSGYVFNNLLNCENVSKVSLTHIFRQGKTSDIITVAHNILNNHHVDTSLNKESEFIFFPMKDDEIVSQVCQLSFKLKELKRNFQVISPMHDGVLGVNNLNQELRDVLNPDSLLKTVSYVKSGETGLYEGDRVMVVKNNYDKMIYNGDVGKITQINIKNDEVEVKIFDWFDQESSSSKYADKLLTFTVEEARSMLKVSYACTTHKVQGQEFDYIIMPMSSQYGIMLYRNLVYTAITRAKKKVFIFGSTIAFENAINNIKETIRNSDLANLIKEYYKLECANAVMIS